MICQVIVHDYLSDNRITYCLDDNDFTQCKVMVLPMLHTMIVQVLNGMTEEMYSDVSCIENRHLTSLLCGLVNLLQTNNSTIEVIRLHRLSETSVIYDYTATLIVPSYGPD